MNQIRWTVWRALNGRDHRPAERLGPGRRRSARGRPGWRGRTARDPERSRGRASRTFAVSELWPGSRGALPRDPAPGSERPQGEVVGVEVVLAGRRPAGNPVPFQSTSSHPPSARWVRTRYSIPRSTADSSHVPRPSARGAAQAVWLGIETPAALQVRVGVGVTGLAPAPVGVLAAPRASGSPA